ncbi:MAG: DUF1778 domain-containing protein [Bifidobacteriaceae bacterium]|jgi:uncharacterized protein (DUF1778 family)|nr:DUF1778 domain-containing protein [Bifidobacteriaceae bacterium]
MALTVKDRRLEARISAATDALLGHAADVLGESRSVFVVRSVEERAERVLARNDATVLSETEFDAVMASLTGEGWELPKLARAARGPRPYSRR